MGFSSPCQWDNSPAPVARHNQESVAGIHHRFFICSLPFYLRGPRDGFRAFGPVGSPQRNAVRCSPVRSAAVNYKVGFILRKEQTARLPLAAP